MFCVICLFLRLLFEWSALQTSWKAKFTSRISIILSPCILAPSVLPSTRREGNLFVFAFAGYIGSMGLGMNFFFGPFTSALCDRYGCRVVAMMGGVISVAAMFATSFVNSLVPIYLTYSVLWGMGSSMSYVPTFLMVDSYFERRKSLANGFITAGSAIGALVMGPTLNALLSKVGWKNTMRFLGGVACILVFAAFSYKPPPVKREPAKKKKLIDLSVWKNKGFIVWALALGIFNLGYFVPYVYLVSLNFLLSFIQTFLFFCVDEGDAP